MKSNYKFGHRIFLSVITRSHCFAVVGRKTDIELDFGKRRTLSLHGVKLVQKCPVRH